MRKISMMTAALALGVLDHSGSAVRPVLAATSQAFDGSWNVEVDCPDVGDVKGHNWRFPAEVKSGFLRGVHHSPTNEAMGDLSGRIQPDGQALLTMVARTGAEEFAISHVRPGAPFRYTANVKSDAHSGIGKRNQHRACTLTLTKI
jgi:hypothetical protein